MADINTVYTGTNDYQDPDIVIFVLPGFWPWSPKREIYLPDEIRDKIRAVNQQAVDTVNAVKVAYVAGSDRTQWLTDRLNAINTRLGFIRTRGNELLEFLKNAGSSAYDGLLKGFSTAISAVPVIGSVVSFAVAGQQAAQAVEQYKLQRLIQDYTSDVTQLGQIRAQLLAELAKAPATTTDPTSNAPTAWPTWYYLAGAGLLLLFFVWYRRRNQKRRKR